MFPPLDFLEKIKHAFPALGITRLGRLTGLDRVGVPVWMAVRPNAGNLSVTQGKGLDDTAAALSAAMEAAELALAEAPHAYAVLLSAAEAQKRGENPFDARRYLRLRQPTPPPDEPIRWVRGLDFLSGEASLVPEEVVGMVDQPGLTYWQASDGLGAGGSLTEAAVHALCELIERDAAGLWSFRNAEAALARECDPAWLGDKNLGTLAERIAAAGLVPRLFDITTDIGIPAFLATVAPQVPDAGQFHFLDLASGTGAHPFAAKAATRAMLEAVQTRLTTIAGARDDISPGTYTQPLPPHLAFYCGPAKPRATTEENWRQPSARSAPALLAHLLDRLGQTGIGSAVLVSFEAEPLGFSACRMLVPDLEQDPATRNRRLGRRALRAMTGMQ